ncbi:hypothetical protein GOV13_04805 [Candidatus Pacearchaeota archaeon]|nr:hypothetical protein [Candidatus Pacearchaeota archaeon]
MKAENIAYGEVVLHHLNELGEVPFDKIKKGNIVSGDKVLKEILEYLINKDFIIETGMIMCMGGITTDSTKYKLSSAGAEVVLGKREYIESSNNLQTVHNQTNFHNSPNSQAAQTTGSESPITQTQNNIQITILDRMIDDDPELDDEKKTGLKRVVRKIKEMKDAGETAEKIYGWVKKGISVSAKYGPYLIALLN